MARVRTSVFMSTSQKRFDVTRGLLTQFIPHHHRLRRRRSPRAAPRSHPPLCETLRRETLVIFFLRQRPSYEQSFHL